MIISSIDPRIRIIRKTAAQTVNNSTVLVNDTHLKLTVAANSEWYVILYMNFMSDAAADLDITFTAPAGAAGQWCAFIHNSVVLYNAFAAERTFAGGGAAVPYQRKAEARILNGATAGTLQLQFAQNVAQVVDTTMSVGSVMCCLRIK